MKKNIQSHITRALGLAMLLTTLFSGCSKESEVKPDDQSDNLSGIKMIDGGKYHTMLLKTDGTLWATGNNEEGQLGTGDNISKYKFTKVLTNVVEVACGRSHTLALKRDGSVWVTGANEKGQLGTGNSLNINAFWKVLNDTKTIDAGDQHSMALHNNMLLMTGDNTYGQLALDRDHDLFTEVEVIEANSIFAGAYQSFVIDENDNLWGTGANFYGQLGAFDFENQTMFSKIISGIKKISSGWTYTMALKEDDTFIATGIEYYIAHGPKGVSEFYEVTGHDVTDVVSGMNHYLFVSDSSLWGVGLNTSGQLGIEPQIQDSFVKLIDSNVARVFAGYYSTWYIDGQGRLWATGANTKGELGTGDMETRREFDLIEL